MSTIAATGVTVAIAERRVPAPPEANSSPTDMVVGFDVTVGGVPVEALVLGYEVAHGEGGPQVTFTVLADSVSVGAVPVSKPEQARAARQRVWEPTPADPRRNIPGWEPEGTPEVRDV